MFKDLRALTFSGEAGGTRRWAADRTMRYSVKFAFYDDRHMIRLALRESASWGAYTTLDIPYSSLEKGMIGPCFRADPIRWVRSPDSRGVERSALVRGTLYRASRVETRERP
jgi:hypothetical protein